MVKMAIQASEVFIKDFQWAPDSESKFIAVS